MFKAKQAKKCNNPTKTFKTGTNKLPEVKSNIYTCVPLIKFMGWRTFSAVSLY